MVLEPEALELEGVVSGLELGVVLELEGKAGSQADCGYDHCLNQLCGLYRYL